MGTQDELTICQQCGRPNCRVDLWRKKLEEALPEHRELAQVSYDAARVSCFIRGGQKKRGETPR